MDPWKIPKLSLENMDQNKLHFALITLIKSSFL